MQYPNNIKKSNNHLINYKNRGMNLEHLINVTNEYYLNNDIALIYKKPTPIGIAKVKYTNNKKLIESAYFKEASTLDYNGIYKGKYLDFDAKETNNKTSFPLSNIHNHQLIHLEKVIKHGGISFLIISINNEFYLLNGPDIIEFTHKEKRKSIPYNYIKEKGYKLDFKINPPLDYLKIINDICKGEFI